MQAVGNNNGNGYDFEGLAHHLLNRINEILPAWLPGGELHGREYVCGSVHGESGSSCSVNSHTGAWADFATNERGGDLTSLYATQQAIPMGDAYNYLARQFDFEPHSYQHVTKPTPAPMPVVYKKPPPTQPNFAHHTYGAPVKVWTYFTPDGDVIFYWARYDKPSDAPGKKDKAYAPFSWNATQEVWHMKSPPAPRPLYRLPALKARPIPAPVLICEGEKAADAAHELLGRFYVVTTWPNGVQSLTKADFSPLAGRNILIWPDADPPGIKCASQLAQLLAPSCPTIKIIDVSDRPFQWDADDALAEGWGTEQTIAWAKPRTSLYGASSAPVITDDNVGKAPNLLGHDIASLEPESLIAVMHEAVDPFIKQYRSDNCSFYYLVTDPTKQEVAICQNVNYLQSEFARRLREACGKATMPRHLNKAFDVWKLYGEALPAEPAPFTWSDQLGWTHKRLDFTPTEGPMSAWSEFLLRLSNADEFMAFIWSVFETRNESRQFLYLHDPRGQGGKSTVLKVLGDIFGNAFCSLNNSMVSGAGNRWLMSTIYGKRLVAWADCKNPKFCMSEIVRNITSGDNVVVEFKGLPPFSVRMYAKLIIGSNHEPEISSGGADTSRLIRLDVSENTNNKSDPQWEKRLVSELPGFLFECRRAYERLCPNHGQIELTDKTRNSVLAATELIESQWEDVASRRLVFGDGFETDVTSWRKLCREEHLSGHEIGRLKEYLIRHHGVEIVRETSEGHKAMRYRKFCVKDERPGQTSFYGEKRYQ